MFQQQHYGPILPTQQPDEDKIKQQTRIGRASKNDRQVCQDDGEAVELTNRAIQSALQVGFSKRKGKAVTDTFPLRQLQRSRSPREPAYASAPIREDTSMIQTASMMPTASMGIPVVSPPQLQNIHANMSSVRGPSHSAQHSHSTATFQVGGIPQNYYKQHLPPMQPPILLSNGPSRHPIEPSSTQAVENLIGSSRQAMQAQGVAVIAAIKERGAEAMPHFMEVLAQTIRVNQIRIIIDLASRDVGDVSLRAAVIEASRSRIRDLSGGLR